LAEEGDSNIVVKVPVDTADNNETLH